MKSLRAKGTQDLLPADMEHFRFIGDVFRSCCVNWGYQEVRTPTLEYLHLFTATGTLSPAMLGRAYSFLDWDGWSGERVVLRPDGTIPVVRLYIENLREQGLAKLFYVTHVFAFEETGKENRERWQCGVELLGDARIASDVEVMSLASEVWRGLGLTDVELRLSHAGVIRAVVREMGLDAETEARTLSQLTEGNWDCLRELQPAGADINQILSLLFSLKGRSSGFLKNLLATFPGISNGLKSSLDDFARLTVLLDTVSVNYAIDITSAPGFEYYSGVCFQFWLRGKKVGGGGRYDQLVPLLGGGDVPACGFALYMDPLMGLLDPKAGKRADQGVLVTAASTAPEVVKVCFDLAQSLRNAGFVAELDFSGRQVSPWRWSVSVTGPDQPLSILDQVDGKIRQAASVPGAVNVVGG